MDALGNAELYPTPRGYRWQWHTNTIALKQILWYVAHAAVVLLSSDGVQRVKECAGANDCGWWFYDESKNFSRRWRSMEGCGSRVKARRQYARKTAYNFNTGKSSTR
jgi:predicted RNA-binding Zn ribbon-like protein